MKISVNELNKYVGEEITFSGFIDTIRDKKWVMFVILRDATGKVQMTIEKSEESNKEMLEILSNTKNESTIKVTGKLVENEAVKLGGIEIIPSSVEITSKAEDLPFDFNNLDGVNIDTRMDYKWIDMRNPRNTLIRQVESCMTKAMRDYLYSNNFTEIHSPKLIGAASESGSEVFKVKYFDGDA